MDENGRHKAVCPDRYQKENKDESPAWFKTKNKRRIESERKTKSNQNSSRTNSNVDKHIVDKAAEKHGRHQRDGEQALKGPVRRGTAQACRAGIGQDWLNTECAR